MKILSLECLDKSFSFSCGIFDDLAANAAGQKLHQAALHHEPDGAGNVEEGSDTNLKRY